MTCPCVSVQPCADTDSVDASVEVCSAVVAGCVPAWIVVPDRAACVDACVGTGAGSGVRVGGSVGVTTITTGVDSGASGSHAITKPTSEMNRIRRRNVDLRLFIM